MENATKSFSLSKILLNPWFVLLGGFVGIIIGIFFKNVGLMLEPIGDIYLSFLKMCIIPIIVTIVISSVADILKSQALIKHLKKFLLYVILSMILASFFGLVVSYVVKPGRNLGIKAEIGIGRIITKHQLNDKDTIIPESIIYTKKQGKTNKIGLLQFIKRIVPINIFNALTHDRKLQILFFALLFGVALGFIPDSINNGLLRNIKAIYSVFNKLIVWALYLLPFALCFIFAATIAKSGVGVVLLLLKYILTIYLSVILILMADTLIICRATRASCLNVFSALKGALLITFASGNEIVGIPLALKGMQTKLKADERISNLILPIGVNVFQFATTFVFAFNAIFFMQIFDIKLGITNIFIILIGSILAGIFTLGLPPVLILQSLVIVFSATGVPVAPALAITLAVVPIVSPLLNLGDFYTNCALTTVFARKRAG